MGVKVKRLGKGQSEAEFQRKVIAYARLRGWQVAAFRQARTLRGWRTAVQGDGAGWPDLVFVRGRRILAAELKVGHGRATAAQEAWLLVLQAAGVPAVVWTPDCWPEI